MTITYHQNTVNRIKEILNPKNNAHNTVAALRAEGEDIAKFLYQFPGNYKVFLIGDSLFVKSLLPRESKTLRWIWCTVSETPHWRELCES